MHKSPAANWDTSNQVLRLYQFCLDEVRILNFIAIIALMISGAVQYSDAFFGEGSGPVHLDRVVCAGTEYNLTDCETGWSNGGIGHSQDIGVKCQTSEGKINGVILHCNK